MASTYTPIATTTLGSAVSSYTFSSIPSTYTDLIIVANAVSSASQNDLRIRFNSDTGSNYSETYVRGNGSTATSVRESNQTSAGMGWMDNTVPATFTINVMNYANSTTYKSAIGRLSDTGTSNWVGAVVGLWRSTSAINSITLLAGSGTISTGSTFTLYGIQAA